jgi:hypothetical protein
VMEGCVGDGAGAHKPRPVGDDHPYPPSPSQYR